jgi:hypothetical protein
MMADRELPVAIPSFCWKNLLSVCLKICGSQAKLEQLHDGFDLQDTLSHQCVIVMELISDYLQGFINWYISEKTDIKANYSI